QLIESYILTPRIVGDRIGLHPVAVIFAIMAGGQLFGFDGMLIALPVAAAGNVLLRFARERYTQSRRYAGGGPRSVLGAPRPAGAPRRAAPRRRGGARGPGGRGRPARRRRLTPMPARTPSPQLPLALRYPPDQRLETFAGDRALPLQLRQFAGGGAGRT